MPDPTPNTPPTPTGPASAPPAETWFSGWAPEDVGYLQTKGWDKPDPAAAALETVKAYREFERFRGVPQSEIARVPTDANDAEGWKSLYRRLGAPDSPDKYDFSGVKFDDDRLTTKFHETLRATAAELNMPQTMAERVAKATAEVIEGYGQTVAQEMETRRAELKTALEANWGQNFDAFRVVADRGAEAIATKMGAGFADKVPELLAMAVENGMGEVMTEMMRVIGAGLGEDRYVQDPSGSRQALTPQQAVSSLQELLGNGKPGSGDADFQKRYINGDLEARKRVASLNAIIAAAREAGTL